ncbi:hypothetical protein [Mesorhizobium sp. CA5]|uniref:hypothetical protein n=1 Tax=Mesorhizobium sp. CA5 TaxID=2876638 RepID=UPI001CD0BC3B|nr:hypothetical protein [Mesorhizobium sp. CA5]MBZ9844050.1 hypothetical protein [Mesorhizobium sp. CA5]
MKIQGFDKLARQLKEASDAMGEIDGQLGNVQFDPADPASIEAAIVEMESMIDQKMGAYTGNPIVAPLIEASKASFRAAIIDKAQAHRLGKKDD